MNKKSLPKYFENTNEEKYNATHKIKNKIKESMKLVLTKRKKSKDKKDYATFQQVFDKKTKKNIEKLINNEDIDKLDYCISSGKEANVYYAMNSSKELNYAVKVYKVMVTSFKDREDYIEGEYRFKMNPGTKSNPHKLINLWALKEYRNLIRIYNKKIKCPKPIIIKKNILIMELLGSPELPAKRLRDVNVSKENLHKIYIKVIKLIRKLFIKCKLVHADLSEYNLLYHNEVLYVIDVSQSVENNHPKCIDFLKRDILNMNIYFNKMNVNVFKLKNIFDFVTDLTIKKEEINDHILTMMNNNSSDNTDKDENEYTSRIYLDKYIPRSLHELNFYQIEKEVIENKNINKDNFSTITGLVNPNQESKVLEEIKEEPILTNEEIKDLNISFKEDKDDILSNASISDKEEKVKKDYGDVKYKGMDKKDRKKLIKEENKEKRKNKVPKHIKKKQDKKRSNHKK